MTEPVTAPCGHSFNKHEIYQYLQVKDECPMCREQLQLPQLKDNQHLKAVICEYNRRRR